MKRMKEVNHNEHHEKDDFSFLIAVVILALNTGAAEARSRTSANSRQGTSVLIGAVAGALVGVIADADGGEILSLTAIGGLVGYLVGSPSSRLVGGTFGKRKSFSYRILTLHPTALSPEKFRAYDNRSPGRGTSVELIRFGYSF